MTVIRRQLIRRIQRDTHRGFSDLVRSCKGLGLFDIARRYAPKSAGAAR